MGGRTVFFDEGPGFLFVKPLGHGVFGSASLVLCIGDGRYYVRKEDLKTYVRDAREPNSEVQNARRVAHVEGTAKIQGWAHYQSKKSGKTFRVSYWDYYTAGTLAELIDRATAARVHIPEEWVCNWAMDMLDIVLEIHKAGVTHRDGHLNNWFITSRTEHGVPKIGLGDFGISESRGACKDWLTMCRMDFEDVYKNIASLLKGRGPHKLHGFVLELQKYVQSANNVTLLHQYMEDLRDSSVLRKAHRAVEKQQKLFQESTPLSLGCYELKDPRTMTFKNFVVAEAHGIEFHLLGKPYELVDRYELVVQGGWTQARERRIRVRR